MGGCEAHRHDELLHRGGLDGEPEVRVWRIADGKVEEEPLDIE